LSGALQISIVHSNLTIISYILKTAASDFLSPGRNIFFYKIWQRKIKKKKHKVPP